jgi:Na+/H+ antiporter NhaD/arsenite permease-like protein
VHTSGVWLTTGIFLATYIGLGVGRLPGLRTDRAGIAVVGAALMMITGVLPLAQAVQPDSISYETLILLFGMMVVVGVLRLAGLFDRIAHRALDHIRGPHGMLAATIGLTGLASAFLVNDVVCVAFTPLVLHLARRLGYDPVPQLIALSTAANIGSVGTITGNPQNMMIGVQSRIPYGQFVAHLGPIALLGLVIDFVVLAVVYRGALTVAAPSPAPAEAPLPAVSLWLRYKVTVVTVGLVVLFFAGFPIALVALGAAAILLLGRIEPAKIYAQVDWSLLIMFAGLFIVVHAFQLHVIDRWPLTEWHVLTDHPIDVLSLAAVGLSNLVSNVPAVLLFAPVIHAMPGATQSTAWMALAMSSTFAGNLTIVGSVANLIVVENAKREGITLTFGEYLKSGIPVTVLTVALGIVWLMFVRY